jgi:hypothetical protein
MGRDSGLGTVEATFFRKDNVCDALVLPLHKTHCTQPLDAAVMSPFKAYQERRRIYGAPIILTSSLIGSMPNK